MVRAGAWESLAVATTGALTIAYLSNQKLKRTNAAGDPQKKEEEERHDNEEVVNTMLPSETTTADGAQEEHRDDHETTTVGAAAVPPRKEEEHRHANEEVVITMLPLETSDLMMQNVSSISTITWYTGDIVNVKDDLRNRVADILRANPWIAGRLAKRRNMKGTLTPSLVYCSNEETLVSQRLDVI